MNLPRLIRAVLKWQKRTEPFATQASRQPEIILLEEHQREIAARLRALDVQVDVLSGTQQP